MKNAFFCMKKKKNNNNGLFCKLFVYINFFLLNFDVTSFFIWKIWNVMCVRFIFRFVFFFFFSFHFLFLIGLCNFAWYEGFIFMNYSRSVCYETDGMNLRFLIRKVQIFYFQILFKLFFYVSKWFTLNFSMPFYQSLNFVWTELNG